MRAGAIERHADAEGAARGLEDTAGGPSTGIAYSTLRVPRPSVKIDAICPAHPASEGDSSGDAGSSRAFRSASVEQHDAAAVDPPGGLRCCARRPGSARPANSAAALSRGGRRGDADGCCRVSTSTS